MHRQLAYLHHRLIFPKVRSETYDEYAMMQKRAARAASSRSTTNHDQQPFSGPASERDWTAAFEHTESGHRV